MSKRLKIFIVLLTALAAGLFGVFFYDLPHITGRALPKGEMVLDDHVTKRSLDGDELRLELSFEPMYMDKLKLELGARSSISPRIEISILREGEEPELISDINPFSLDREVLNIRQDRVTSLDISVRGCDVEGISLINRPSLNPYVFICGAALGLCISILILFRAYLAKRLELCFLIIALTMGGLMCGALPRDKIGYDDEEHLKAVLDMAVWPGSAHISDTIYSQLSVNEFSSILITPGSFEEMRDVDAYLAGTGDYRSGSHVFDHYLMKNRAPAYGAMALAMKLSMLLGLSWPLVIMAARAANLLMYIILMYIAIRKVPVGKLLLFVIGLFPQNIFMACTFSYDPFVTGCLFCGMAFMLSAFLGSSEKEIRPGVITDRSLVKDYALSAFFMFLGCLPKAVYAPLLLMLCAPAVQALIDRLRKKRDEGPGISVFLLSALVFAILVASFILPTVIAPSETGDLRGGATSEVSQVGYILSDPLGYAGLLIGQMISWIPQCFIGPDCTTFMGGIVSGTTGFRGFWIPYFLLILGSCLEPLMRGMRYLMKAMEKLWILLMILGSSVLIWTSMYVAFTEPGADSIAGVQGRYFIPLMFPLYLVLSSLLLPLNERIRSTEGGAAKLETAGGLWYYLMMIAAALLLWLSITVTVIIKFCL